jgi:pyruvate/2-oxoglutarate dehydrogenase complex dihydrolipoamide acyltransferase (E2) component
VEPGSPEPSERLSWAERWLTDAFEVFHLPAGFIADEVDMSRVVAAKAAWQARGVRVTFTTFVVRAAALALARLPEVHVLLDGYRRVRPRGVDVGVSVAGTTNYAPVVVLRDAERREVDALAEELERRAAEARKGEAKALADLSRVAWLVPFSWLRRVILRLVFSSLKARRKLVGTFQISTLPAGATAVFQFLSAAVLGVGRVADRVVAVDGRPAVRPTMLLTLSIDHRALDGARAARLLGAIRELLEDGAALQPPALQPPLMGG